MSSHRFVRREQRQAEAEPGQVKRYWPGRAPDWYKEEKDEEVEEQSEDEAGPAAFGKLAVEDGPAFGAVAAPSIVKKADPRLQRLQQAQKAASDEPRQIAAAQVVSRRRHSTPSDSEEEAGSGADRDGADSDDEDGPEAPARAESDPEEDADALARRAALRARLQASAAQEEQLIQAPGDDLESEESSGEYETDSEDDTRQLLKPTFTHARDRETIAERERLEKEEQRKEADKQRQLELRKADTHNLVIDQLRIEDAAVRAAKAGPKEIGDVDTDDDMDEAAEQQEYELWKSREMARIRRNKEVREKADAAEEEREMLKHMNEEERRQWERDNPKEAHLGNKQKWRFLQKYWHKGAYFQDASDNAFIADRADDIFDRDYSMPTGEDKLDKTVLPKVMQVKNFGRRGRTKYTHLVDQDTTEFTDPSAQDMSLRHKRRLAGTDLEFSRPKALRT